MINRTAMRKLEHDIRCASQFDGRVMISGERGTGKKLSRILFTDEARETRRWALAHLTLPSGQRIPSFR